MRILASLLCLKTQSSSSAYDLLATSEFIFHNFEFHQKLALLHDESQFWLSRVEVEQYSSILSSSCSFEKQMRASASHSWASQLASHPDRLTVLPLNFPNEQLEYCESVRVQLRTPRARCVVWHSHSAICLIDLPAEHGCCTSRHL